MRTKELLKKEKLTKEEKKIILKRLGLLKEWSKEVTYYTNRARKERLLSLECSWEEFIKYSFDFALSKRGHSFWWEVAMTGKKLTN